MDWKIRYIYVKFCGNCIHTCDFIINFMANFKNPAQVELPSNIIYKTWITKVQIYTAWKVSVFGVSLLRIFPHSDWIRYLSVFSPNAGKYGPEKTPCLDTFHVVPYIIVKQNNRYVIKFIRNFKNLISKVTSMTFTIYNHYILLTMLMTNQTL